MSKPTENSEENQDVSVGGLSCFLNDSNDLDGIIDKMSSDHSDEIECEFEGNLNIDSMHGVKEYYQGEMKNREVIPETIRGMAANFCEGLIGQFGDRKGSDSKEDRKSISTMVKTGFLDYPKPSSSLSSQREIQNANKLIMDLNVNSDNKGSKRVQVNKKFEEGDLLNINIEDENEHDKLLNSNDSNAKKKAKATKNVKPKDKRKDNSAKQQKHVLSDSGELIDDSIRK